MALIFLFYLLLYVFNGAHGFRTPQICTSRGSKIFVKVSWHPCWTVGIYEPPDKSASSKLEDNGSKEESEAALASHNSAPSGKSQVQKDGGQV